MPRFPHNVTDMTDDVLMDEFGQNVEWQNFLSTLLADLEEKEAEAEGKVKLLEAAHMVSEKMYQGKAAANSDPHVIQARADYKKAKNARKAMEVAIANRDRAANFLSRELTRRVGREPNNRRVDRFTP